MLSYLSDTDLISRLACKIIEPKQTYYNEDPIYFTLASMNNIAHVDSAVFNKYDERLKVSLFYDKTAGERDACVIFMHGYGSNRVEAISILPHLPKEYSLCCFDFSGEGKSDGDIVTFGEKEKYDIRAIVNYLRSCGYSQFILWGRSMGATCTLLYTQKEKPPGVFLQILDSPFVSFEEAAFDLTKKRAKIPQVILKMALEAVKENIAKKSYSFNPFQVNLAKRTIQSDIPTIFVYSEQDDIVNPENSHRIMKNFEGHYEKYIINEHHNSIRHPKTLKDIISLIKKYHSKACKPDSSQNNTKKSAKNKNSSVNVCSQNKGLIMSVGSPSQRNVHKMHASIPTNLRHKYQIGSGTPIAKISQDLYDFDNYGFIGQPHCKVVTANKNIRKDKHKINYSRDIIKQQQRQRPRSSLKVYSAEVSKDMSRQAITTPINLRGSQATRTSQSLPKPQFVKNKLSNDFYL